MTFAYYKDDQLYIENVKLQDVVTRFGTPCYVYSKGAIQKNWQRFDNAFAEIPHLVCYAVKANSNIAILNLLAQLNSGFDIVSIGELERVMAAKGAADKVIFSGVAKTVNEMTRAIGLGIFCFDIESIPELHRLQQVAENLKQKVNVAIRINPDVDAHTHEHISTGLKINKFGIANQHVLQVANLMSDMPNLELVGLAYHIGSQLLAVEPFLEALDQMLVHYHALQKQGFHIKHLNIGGGLGIKYHTEQPPGVDEYAQAIIDRVSSYPIKLIIEPGRAIVGNAGLLLTTVEYLKHDHKNFVIVDAGMNDFVRPAFYDAWHDILPLRNRNNQAQIYDIVGPVCESSDFLAKDRQLCIESGDVLAIAGTGAYGFSMSSNYNTRCRAAEILVEDDRFYLIRRRETIEDLLQLEYLI